MLNLAQLEKKVVNRADKVLLQGLMLIAPVVIVCVQVLTRIRGFAAMNRLKKEALKVIAANLPPEEIVGLREMFEAMDKDGRYDHRTQHATGACCACTVLQTGHI